MADNRPGERHIPGKYKGDRLRQVPGPNGDVVTIMDRRPYWKAYYQANKEAIRARQDPHIRELRRLAKARKLEEAGKGNIQPEGTSSCGNSSQSF